MNTKVLITGGTGLVGVQIENGIKISSKDFDLRDPIQTNKMFEIYDVDKVIHTAAKVGGLGANMNYNLCSNSWIFSQFIFLPVYD